MTNVEFSSDVVRSATFREKLKGYNPEDVHAFMERAATAIDQLTARLAESSARALKAEAALASNSEADESVRRTLVLAQRTAEMAVREANEEAATIRFEAHREADELLERARQNATAVEAEANGRAESLTREATQARAEADAHAAATVAQADSYAATTVSDADTRAAATVADAEARAEARTSEAEARAADVEATVAEEFATRRAEALAEVERLTSDARQEADAAIAELRAQRDQLWADVEALSTYLTAERARVLEVLHGAVERFGETLEPSPRPDVAAPEPAPAAGRAHLALVEPARDAEEDAPGDEQPLDVAPDAIDHETRGAATAGEDGHDWDDAPAAWAAEPPADGREEPAWTAHDIEGHPIEASHFEITAVETTAVQVTGPQAADPWAAQDRPSWADEDAAAAPSWTVAQDPYTAEPGWDASAPEAPQWPAPAAPATWGQAQEAHETGWLERAVTPGSSDAPPAFAWGAEAEPEPAWGQPVETGYRPGWVDANDANDATEPAWEWPGRTDTPADLGPASAWFGAQPQAATPPEPAWGEAPGTAAPAAWSPPPPVAADPSAWPPAQPYPAEPSTWATPQPLADDPSAWAPPGPGAWSGWAETDPADPAAARDPWEGIEPVEEHWEAGDVGRHATEEDEPPSRLMFTLGDEARRNTSSERPEGAEGSDAAPKPRKTLLGRLRG